MNSEVSIPNTMMKKKVLLMGKNGAGKTSMRSIIFANYIGKDTNNQQATTYIDNSEDRLLGNLVLNLWDFGGQETFYENYFIRQQDKIFKNVEVIIYVFDVQSRDIEQDIHYYQNCLTALLKHSPGAKVFCLVHKMDLIPEEKRDIIFKERENYLKKLSKPLDITCFCTSIWDETLYNTWSSIVSMLVPNIKKLEKSLNHFTNLIEADEVLLFERKTFLKICHCIRKPHIDEQRFEKVSNILKQFKLSCKNVLGQFESIQICNSKFLAYIGVFTANTYIMVILSDPSLKMAAILINIFNARELFERLEIDNQ